ncbi:MAG: beta-1,3-glucanase family protein [Alphaproteobacteria bacterium]
MATPLRVEFTNQNTTYGPDQMWITMVVDPGQNVCFGGTTEQVPFANSFNNSPTYQITDNKLKNGIDVYSATSLRFFVSIGTPLKACTFEPGQWEPGQCKGFGGPTFTNPQDPNWHVRWDIFELTVSNPRSPDDLGDLSTINGYGIPMMIDTFTLPAPGSPGKGLTTARSYAGTAPYGSLETLMKKNSSNNNLGGVPANGIVKNGTSFLRLIGPPNGAFSHALATGGPFPSFNFYLTDVYNKRTKTPITDVGRISGHTWDLTAGATAEQMTLNGKIDGKPFTMAVDADTNVGKSYAMYTFSSMVYQAAGTGTQNPGLHFTYDGKPFTEAELVSKFGLMKTLAEIYHDVFSAYCFGLIGNNAVVKGWTDPIYGKKSINDMGSAGWVKLAGDVGAGKVQLSNVPLFSRRAGMEVGFHNEWASRIYTSSSSVYGFAYSDFFQFPIGQHTYKLPNGTPVNSWRVTVLPDPK